MGEKMRYRAAMDDDSQTIATIERCEPASAKEALALAAQSAWVRCREIARSRSKQFSSSCEWPALLSAREERGTY